MKVKLPFKLGRLLVGKNPFLERARGKVAGYQVTETDWIKLHVRTAEPTTAELPGSTMTTLIVGRYYFIHVK